MGFVIVVHVMSGEHKDRGMGLSMVVWVWLGFGWGLGMEGDVGMECLIRGAMPEDAEAISRLIVAALRESNARDYSPEIIEEVERSFSPLAVVRLLEVRQVFVAVVGGCVVGTAGLDGDTVRSVFVEPGYQGGGIGRLLMERVEDVAAGGGVDRLWVPSSITAEEFYLSLGFSKVRDEFHGGERTIVMEKWIG
jgi:GNAT superfamily N-acetyltransferase